MAQVLKRRYDDMRLSEEQASIIHQASTIISQHWIFSKDSTGMPAAYTSQSQNQNNVDGWNGPPELQNQSWDPAQPIANPSYTSTPAYSSHPFGQTDLSSFSNSGLTVPEMLENVNDYDFSDLYNFGSQDPPPQFILSPPPNGTSMASPNNVDMSRQSSLALEDRQSSSDGSTNTSHPRGKRRKQFTAEKQEEIGNTRKRGACIRCRQKKITCVTDKRRPYGSCLTCQNPKISKGLCLRYNISEAILFREGNAPSLAWSQRWNNMKMIDVVDWESLDMKHVKVSHGLCQDPILLEVRKFVPKDGDALDRKWVDGQERKTKRVEPYAIINMTKAAQEVMRYINSNVYPCLITLIENYDSLFKETYLLAHKRSRQTDDEESALLRNVLTLWFAIRHTTSSEYLCGSEMLGMQPEQNDLSYPLFGKIPIAPVMGAQLELILTLMVLRPLRKEVLKQLQKLIKPNKPEYWFTIYLSCFILLHSCSLATAWHYTYSRRNGEKDRYAMPYYIRELHHGANLLLGHFNYCNKGSHPFLGPHAISPSIARLNEEQTQLVAKTKEYFKGKEQSIREAKKYGHFENDMYFVSQLFEQDWQPGPSV